MSKGTERPEASKRKRGREQNENERNLSPKRQRQSDDVTSPAIKLEDGTPLKKGQQASDDTDVEEKRRRRKELKKARKQLRREQKRQQRADAKSSRTEDRKDDASVTGTKHGESTVNGQTQKKAKKQSSNDSIADASASAQETQASSKAKSTTTALIQSSKDRNAAIAPNIKTSNKPSDIQQTARRPPKPWFFSSRQGGRYADQDPVFVTDKSGAEYLVTAQGDAVHVLSVNDSLIAKTLPAKDGRRVISLHAVSTEREDLVRILYDDRTLVDWDWITGSEEKSKLSSSDVNLYRLAPLENRIASIYTTWTGSKCHILLDGVPLYELHEPVLDIRMYHGTDIIVALSHRLLIIGKRDAAGQDYTWIELGLQQPALSLDVRLFDASLTGKKKAQPAMSVAIGHADGKIHLHSNVMSLFSTTGKPSLPTPRILHWHRNAVASVKFSEDGLYLISGGKETVLVIWQLETGQKSFLPNLTAEIDRIVVNPTGDRYAVQLGDNSIMVLSTSELKPVAYFVGLQMAAYTQGSINGPQKLAAVLHPVRKNELLLTVPASQPRTDEDSTSRPFLQTFGTSMASFSTRQALARNNVTDFNVSPAKVPIVSPDVKLLAISSDGQWLATVDEWTPPTLDTEHVGTTDETGERQETERQEVYLKFWQWHAPTAKWLLNSRIDGPHSTKHDALAGTIVGSVFRLNSMPSRDGFVTIGQDCKAKMWVPKVRSRHGEILLDSTGAAQVEWTCQMSAELEIFDQREDMEMEGDRKPLDATLAISEDGSLIAAALTSTVDNASNYNETVHFIDTKSGKIRAGNHSIAAPGLLELAFADRSLVALSPRTLRVWDVVEDMLQSSINIPAGDNALQDQIPLFALNKLDNAAVIASPGYLTVVQMQPPLVKMRIPLQQSVAAVLAIPRERGFLVVYDDATTSTLSSVLSSTISEDVALASSDVAVESNAVAVVDEPQEAKSSLLDARLAVRGGDDEEVQLMIEDDRRVVRPEDMAKIFDEGADGMALPSVKEMFHAVAGLFGRKPRSVAVRA